MDVVLKRLQRNIEKMNEKYMEFKEVERGKSGENELKYNEKNDLTYQVVMELIMWVINTNDLLYKNFSSYRKEINKNIKISKMLFGVRHAFNMFKHNMAILSVEEKEHIPFFSTDKDDYCIEQTVWLDVTNITVNGDRQDARQAYVDYLQNRTLQESFNAIIPFLNAQYNDVLANSK